MKTVVLSKQSTLDATIQESITVMGSGHTFQIETILMCLVNLDYG